jgi:light-regulated signal transduction histidine kinase (bacteriophytochrome)
MKETIEMLVVKGIKDPIIDELYPECRKCVMRNLEIIDACPIDKKRARHTKIENEHGYIFGCTKKSTLVLAKKIHHAVLSRHLPFLKELLAYTKQLDERYDKEYKRLLHNIESHDAHIIQEFQYIASEEDMARAARRHREFIADTLSADPIKSARALLKIFQSAIGIKTEITIYQRLYLDKNWEDNKKNYSVHPVVMNTAYKFFEDFSASNIILNIGECYESVLIDYECVSIILYHLLDNAGKYVLKSTSVDITFHRLREMVVIELSMMSVATEASEYELVFKEGYSGENVRKLKKQEKQGKGYGMAIIKEISSRCKYLFEVDWNVERKRILVGDVPYTRNVFRLGLPYFPK